MIRYSERGSVSGGPNLELYNKLFWTATSIFLLPLPHNNHGSQLEKGKFCPEDNLRQYVLRPVQAFQPVKILDKKLKKYSSKDLLRQFQYGLQFHPLLLSQNIKNDSQTKFQTSKSSDWKVPTKYFDFEGDGDTHVSPHIH